MKPIALPFKHIGIHLGLLQVVLLVLFIVWFCLHRLSIVLASHLVPIPIHEVGIDPLPLGMYLYHFV
jgi:hypothetical protein